MAYSIAGLAMAGLAKGASLAARGAFNLAGGAAVAAGWTGKKVGTAALNVAGKVGTNALEAAEGAGTVLVKTLGSPEHREGLIRSWGAIASNVGEAFMKRDAEGKLHMTKFGVAAVAGAGMFNNSRDLYDKEKARRMGDIDNQKKTLTPTMRVPQYEFNPRKRMGALDGGASGDLVFALHNNR